MPTPLTPLDIAELALVAAGLLIILGGAAITTRRRGWRHLLYLPPQPPHVLEPADLLIGLAAILLMPSIFYQLFALGESAATESTLESPEAPDPRQVLALACGQAVAATLIVVLCRQRFHGGLSSWGLSAKKLGLRAVQALGGYIAVWPLCLALLYVTFLLIQYFAPDFTPPEHSAILTLLSRDSPPWVIAVTVLSTALLAPVLEEVFFRGLLQPALVRWTSRPWMSILLAGAAFGLFHLPLWHTVPALTAFGVVLGYLYAKTGSLTLVIFLHAAFNAKTLIWLAMGAESHSAP
jgi:membrane protease YdiL (CAAX protease family)